jgi:hypothetical protein
MYTRVVMGLVLKMYTRIVMELVFKNVYKCCYGINNKKCIEELLWDY